MIKVCKVTNTMHMTNAFAGVSPGFVRLIWLASRSRIRARLDALPDPPFAYNLRAWARLLGTIINGLPDVIRPGGTLCRIRWRDDDVDL